MEPGQLLEAIREETEELTREMPFEAYLEEVRGDARLARLSHALVHDAILAAGVSAEFGGRARYDLFRERLFGADEAIRQVVDYLAAAARRLDVRKRILLLVGPPGCGKSTLVNTLKKALEDYTRTHEGPVFAIAGCPVQEDPLHLIPPHRRAELPDVHIEGELCPYCRWLVRRVYRGRVAEVPVERVVFSEADGIGMGTFVATDPGSEDLTRLVGRVDLSRLRGTDRSAARQAFALDGELNAANRGLADLIEVFKMDERFLAVLLTLTQEQLIKIGGRGTMYADEAVVAHSNLAEYEALVADPKAAALQDRLVVVRMGYALSVGDEVRIYEKLLGEAGLGQAHVSPLALPAAATFAVLTRLRAPRGGAQALLEKLRLYDGRFVRDLGARDYEAFRAAAPEEGSTGVSPRFVINQLSQALGRWPRCLSGSALLDALWAGLGQRAGFTEEDRAGWADVLAAARAENDDFVRRAVRRAMVPGFRHSAQALARDLRRELEVWADGAPDEDLPTARRIERALGVPHHRRRELRDRLLLALRAGDVEDDLLLERASPGLVETLEAALLPSWHDAARKLLEQEDGLEASRERRLQLRSRLIDEQGLCGECADELLRHAVVLAGGGRERQQPRVFRWRGG